MKKILTYKTKKQHWNLENILYLVGGGGGGQPDPRKKIVSVGSFSTFRHPLAGKYDMV